MKKIFTLAISVAVAALASVSCSSLMEKDINPGGNQVQFKTNISSFATKADQSLNGFQSGDAVGVIAMEPILKLNVKYTADGNKLVSDSPICWLEGQDRGTEFMAYYPYDPEFNYLTEYNYNISVKTDQSSPENYHASDFLTAWAEAYPGETVKLEFTHLLSRVDLSVGGELAQKIVSVSLCGVGATYNVGSEGVGEPTSIKAAEITSGNKKFWSVIIVPQVANPTLEIVTSDGAKKTVAINKEVRFQSGKRYQAELHINAEGSLEAEFVYRVFDWLNGDYVWFDAYRESWSVCGNFCDWNTEWAYDMEREAKGIYSLVMYLPEEAEFKFVKERSWEECFGAAVRGDDGEYRSLPLSIGQVVDLLPGGDGVNLYYPQGGRVRIVLNTIEKTAIIQPGDQWYIVRNRENDKDEFETLFDYTGEGYNYVVGRYYAKAGTGFYLRNDDWTSLWAPEDSGCEYDENGNYVKKIVWGEPLKLSRSGAWLCFDKTGFVDLALDAENYIFTVTECQDQSISVEDVAKLPEGTAVNFESITVYAASTEGYVVSLDGKTGLNVYVGLGNPVPAVGDVISLSGTKTTYCQLPELINATFTVLSHSDLGEVQYQNYSGTLTSSVPIKLTGTLKVRPYTKQEACLIETNRGLFRMHYLPEDYLKYYNSAITVTGWFGGYANDYCYITITSMEGLTEKQMAAGTLKDPFDPVDAVLYSRSLAAGSESAEEVYIRGYVSEILENYSTAVPAASFRITNGGNISSECYFGIDKAFFLEGKPWQLGNSTLNRYNETVVCAKVCVAEDGRTTKTVAEKGYIYSLNGRTSEDVDPVEYIGDGTAENPFNVPAAIAYTQALEPNTESADVIYIKGKINGIREEFGEYYGNASFNITEKVGSGIEFYAYRVMYLGNRKWRKDDTQIHDGDDVVICGKVANYNGNTPETVGGKAYLYALNGVTVEPVISPITIDGDFSDWEALDPEKYSVAYSATYPKHDVLKVLKAYADDNALFVYIEYDVNKIYWQKDYEHVPFHLFINSDNDNYTGGWGFGFEEPGVDYLLESFLYADGELRYSDVGLFKWAGGNTEQSWSWEWITEGTSSTGAGNGNGAYEIRLERDALPLGDNFSIGVDIQQDWDSVGLLPNENVTGNNPNGKANLLPVNTNGPGVVMKPEDQVYTTLSLKDIVDIASTASSSSEAASFSGSFDRVFVSYTNGSYAYLSDGTQNILLYMANHGLTTGDVISGPVYGSAYLYNGLPEITGLGDLWTVVENVGSTIAPDEVSLAGILNDYNNNLSRLVRLTGVTVTVSSGRNGTIVQDGQEIAIYAQSRYTALPAVNAIGNITGIVSIYGDQKQLSFWEEGWFEKTGEVQPEVPAISDIAGLIAAIPSSATGSNTAVEITVNFTNPATVTYVNGKNTYIQDDTGAILLYISDLGLVPGNTISGELTVTAYWYSGIPEIVSFSGSPTVGNVDPVAPQEVTLAELDANYDEYLLRYVKVNGVTVTDGIADGDRNGTIVQGDYSMAVYAQLSNKGLVLNEGETGSLVAIVGKYKENRQLLYWDNSWFTVGGTSSGTATQSKVWDFSSEEWQNEFAKFAEVGVNVTDWNLTYDGLTLVSSQKSKFNANNFQFGGKGSADDRYFGFTADKAGILTVWVTNTGSSEALDRMVAVNVDGEVTEVPGGYPSSDGPVQIAFDIPAGNVKIYPSGNALRFYKIAYTITEE